MKLQLNEETLNAYISEAIEQEFQKLPLGNMAGGGNEPIKASGLSPRNQGRYYGKNVDLSDIIANSKASEEARVARERAGIRKNPLPIATELFQHMYNQSYGGHLKVDGIWGPETEKAYQDYVKRGGDLQNYQLKQYAPGPNGPVAMNEETLNAYINEAIRQELNEELDERTKYKVDFDKLGKPKGMSDVEWLARRKGGNALGRTRLGRGLASKTQKRMNKLDKGDYGNMWGQSRKNLFRTLRELGYTPEEINNALLNGTIQAGENNGTFNPYDGKKLKKKIKRLAKKDDEIRDMYKPARKEMDQQEKAERKELERQEKARRKAEKKARLKKGKKNADYTEPEATPTPQGNGEETNPIPRPNNGVNPAPQGNGNGGLTPAPQGNGNGGLTPAPQGNGSGRLSRPEEGGQDTTPDNGTNPQVTYPWEKISQEEINMAKQKQAQARAKKPVQKKSGLVRPDQQGQQQQGQAQQPQARPKATAVDPNPTAPVNAPGAEVRKAPVSPNPSTPVNTPGAEVRKAPVNPNPATQANNPGVTPPAQGVEHPSNTVTNAINAMGQQIRSGNPELAERTARTAIQAIQKNGTGSQQEKAAIQQIEAALANMTRNNQQ